MHTITQEEYEAARQASKENQNKHIDQRLKVILQKYEGKSRQEIAQMTGYSYGRVSQLISEFKKQGLEKYIKRNFVGNHRAMSYEEEEELLAPFRKRAEEGQIINVQEIKAIFDQKRGKDTGRGYIYMLLARHQWRKVMPRSRHPKKASEEEIHSSKKLTR